MNQREHFDLVIGVGILIGMVQCLWGYRLFKFVLGLTGFLVGGVLAATAGYTASGSEIVAWGSGLVGGVLGAMLMVWLYFVGVFVIGALLGILVAAALLAVAGSVPEPVVLAISGLVGGVAALVFQRFMIVVSTAFVGAWNVVFGIGYFVTGSLEPTSLEGFLRAAGSHPLLLVGWLALGTVGVIVQYRSIPAKKPPPPASEEVR